MSPTKSQLLDDTAADLWERYWSSRSDEDRNAIVERYMPLIGTAMKCINLPVAPMIDRDDHDVNGSIGLMSAVEEYDSSHGVKFTTYAIRRIIWSVIDGMREIEWKPIGALVQPVASPDGVGSPQVELDDWWRSAMRQLSVRERRVITLYFRGNLTLKQIADSMGLSKSRVKQIKQRAITSLARRMTNEL